ncbi:hypothetical protein [Actinoplanes teichomyceticus]|uniref:Uncharacterized protein n=1 Tax=Actinoplanes teichomyceticus TaxID=1867 RepID=A0A561VCL3_ACTTI|nr:hypothetical protein [Actinoplanes teichomyceticus]TWG09348.1 hypothetical protein FHX34_10863 [Actinoplanes teichomyceticus]GIF16628.1 hypothetical protein Ate01nite_66600 [Actinoplanes teichomyceticus]
MRRVLVASGLLIMAYALVGAVADGQVDLLGVLVFGVAVLLLHDAVFVPLLLAGGALIRRLVPVRWQTTARAVAVIDLAVAVVGLPLVAGFGRRADDPSVLPRPYATGLLLIVVATAVTAVLGRKGIERWRGGRRRRRPR